MHELFQVPLALAWSLCIRCALQSSSPFVRAASMRLTIGIEYSKFQQRGVSRHSARAYISVAKAL